MCERERGMCVCVCVCVRERVCVCEREGVCERERGYVCDIHCLLEAEFGKEKSKQKLFHGLLSGDIVQWS